MTGEAGNRAKRSLDWSRALNVFANTAIVGVAAWAFLGPRGIVESVIKPYMARRAQVRAVALAWERLLRESTAYRVPDNARAVLIEFGDYECPACLQQQQQLPGFLKAHPDVALRFIQYPLAIHQHAELAARAALCAEEQGQFRSMHDRLFASPPVWSAHIEWRAYGEQAGVARPHEFEACISASRTIERIARGIRLGRQLSVAGTPTFVYRGGVHRGLLTEQLLAKLPREHH